MSLFSGSLSQNVTIPSGHKVRVLFDTVSAADGVRWITGENSNDYAVEGNIDGWVALEGTELPAESPCVAQLEIVSGTARARLSRDLDNEYDVELTSANGLVEFVAVAQQANMVALVVEAIGGDVVIAATSALTIG